MMVLMFLLEMLDLVKLQHHKALVQLFLEDPLLQFLHFTQELCYIYLVESPTEPELMKLLLEPELAEPLTELVESPTELEPELV
jgi:hypothetical protein